MEEEREEIYERIPWETLEKQGGDRQWLVYVIAGALVLGALAYSFTRNQPPSPEVTVAEGSAASTVPATSDQTAVVTPPSTVASPVVVAEADLFAVDPERLFDQAAAHAEWLAVEYVSYDGTKESAEVLKSLLPSEIPLPRAPEGTQVFVDWADAVAVTQISQTEFQVDVVVRSLVGHDDAAFVRQQPVRVSVNISLDEEGAPRVMQPPSVAVMDTVPPPNMGLTTVPEEVTATLAVEGEVVGGRQTPDGDWQVVVMATGADGVKRPVTVSP